MNMFERKGSGNLKRSKLKLIFRDSSFVLALLTCSLASSEPVPHENNRQLVTCVCVCDNKSINQQVHSCERRITGFYFQLGDSDVWQWQGGEEEIGVIILRVQRSQLGTPSTT